MKINNLNIFIKVRDINFMRTNTLSSVSKFINMNYSLDIKNVIYSFIFAGIFLIFLGCNKPPYKPSTPIGPSYVVPYVADTFSSGTTDPEGDDIRYRFDWDDGNLSDWSQLLLPSGTECEQVYAYQQEGSFSIRCQAKDEKGKTSTWSDPFTIVCGNIKPLKPERPTGPSVAIPNVPDTFSSVTTDPNGDSVRYQFDWGNGIYSDWSSFLPSGSYYKTTYAYSNKGYYFVTCRAKDEKGATSNWSDPLTVICGLGQIRWMLPADEDFNCEFNSTPAIDNQGNIYAGCTEGHLHSLNSSGQERSGWPFTGTNEDEFISSPTIGSDGTIYACDRGGYVYALNHDGTQKWVKNIVGSDIVATPTVGRNNEIYINTDDGLYAFNAQGQEMWHNVDICGYSSVAIDQSNHLYVGTDSGYLYSLDTAGTIRWRYYIGDEIISSPAITSDGKICFGGYDGIFYILNPDSSLFRAQLIATSISSSPVIGSDGSIYITTDDGMLYKFNSSGIENWFITTDGYLTSSPAVVRYPNFSGDIIYFTVSMAKKKQADEDSLYMIKSDGTVFATCGIFQLSSTEEIMSSPMVGSDGTIYIGGGIDFDSDQGGLFALTGRGTVVNSVWPLFRRDTKNTGRVQQ